MKESLLVISSYPPLGTTHHHSVVGVATYTKNTLLGIESAGKKKKAAPEIIVLAEKLPGGEKDSYTDTFIQVKRLWKRNSLSLFPFLLSEIRKRKETKRVLIELELAMFGGMVQLALFPFFLFFLRTMKKQTTVVLHQVITDMHDMKGHIGIQNPVVLSLVNIGLSLFYRSALLLSHRCIVFDEALSDRLSHFGSTKNVMVIPHGVEAFPTAYTKTQARKKLGLAEKDIVLLYFGFIAWYKGPDILLNAYKNLNDSLKTRVKVIIAGGENSNHQNKTHYKNYVQKIHSLAKELSVQVSGFVPEEDIPLYFSAADTVVLPYRTSMSASGPLSIAFSYEKPILLSGAMAPVLKTADMKQALVNHGISEKDIIYSSEKDLTKRMETITPRQLEDLSDFAKEMQQTRSWGKIGAMYYEAIFR